MEIKTIWRRGLGAPVSEIYVRHLIDTLNLLLTQPEMGKVYQGNVLQSEIRCFPYRSHQIFYQTNETEIFVIDILGKGQLPEIHLP